MTMASKLRPLMGAIRTFRHPQARLLDDNEVQALEAMNACPDEVEGDDDGEPKDGTP